MIPVNHASFRVLVRLIEPSKLLSPYSRGSLTKRANGYSIRNGRLHWRRMLELYKKVLVPLCRSESRELLHSVVSVCRTGSIEKLVDGDRRQIATKHLLPENNINVVIR